MFNELPVRTARIVLEEHQCYLPLWREQGPRSFFRFFQPEDGHKFPPWNGLVHDSQSSAKKGIHQQLVVGVEIWKGKTALEIG